jgi:hypothetical protein
MSVNWQGVYGQILQLSRNAPNAAIAAEASALTSALQSAGQSYDASALGGALGGNGSFVSWVTQTAQPAWAELDRQSRFALSTVPAATSPNLVVSTVTLATFLAFGNLAIAPLAAWKASTSYPSGNIVSASPANGVYFVSGGGTSGSTQPTWTTELSKTTTDNTVTWTAVYPQFNWNATNAIPPFVFDETLEGSAALVGRYLAARIVVGGSPQLVKVLDDRDAAWTAALVAQPVAQTTPSINLTNALYAAMAAASAYLASASFS